MPSPDALIALGVLFLLGLAADAAGQRTRLPRVTLLILLGLTVNGHAENVLRIGTLGSDAISLDPHMSTKSQDKIIFPMIF